MLIQFACRIPRELLRYRGSERAALLVGESRQSTVTVRSIVPCINEHVNRRDHFRISAGQIAFLVGRESPVVGVLHSHEHGLRDPSDNDVRNIPAELIGGVVCDNRITSWYTNEGVIDPLVEWSSKTLDLLTP